MALDITPDTSPTTSCDLSKNLDDASRTPSDCS